MKTRKPIIVSIILAFVAAVMLFAVACGDDYTAPKKYTMSFVTNGGTEIESISAIGGSMIFVPENPTKSNSTFAGWYTDGNFSGEAVQIPNIMPDKNVTYYAKFDTAKAEYSVIYEYNIGKAPHTGDISNVTVEAGSTVTVADGNDYGAAGYMFMGWSIYRSGLVADVKQDGQYNPGDTITVTDKNITLYAQWAVEYTDMRGQNGDKIYVYEPLIGMGKGAAKLVRADEKEKDIYGFVKSGSETESGYAEFSFYADEFEGGEFTGRLYATRKYATSDGMQGQYVMRDHGYNIVRTDCIMALDGFGYATYIEVVGDGSMLHVSASGEYEWDEQHNDYKFTFNRETDADDAKAQVTYFTVTKEEIKDSEGKVTEYNGSFSAIGLLGTLGYESAAYMQYDDGELLYARVDLNGYGDAKYYVYSVTAQRWDKIDEGTYKGTENYDSYIGEWQYIPGDTKAVQPFKFVLSTLSTSSGLLNIFVVFDENKYGRFTADDGSTLYLDGYGEAEYIYNSVAYYGECTIKDGVVTLIQQTQDEDGNIVAGNRFIFTVSGNKFEISKDGCIINDSGVLTVYNGTSAVVSIPEKATKIAANAFNYNNTSVSLISVTIPATVTEIGKYAFQNNYTLRRAEFLSETPIAIDFSADNDPFRWGAGDFVIVVPEGCVQAYKDAWTDCPYTIMDCVEVLVQPTFKVINGVLVRYNKPEGSADLIDLVLPDEVTEIADGVFLGASYLKSVDLSNTVKVGEMAFYGCVNLEKVVFTKVEELGSMAFAACDKLNSSGTKDELALPSIKTIGTSAFSGCESLRLVKLGKDLEQIGDFAFYLCNVNVTDPQVELVVELLGDAAPVMGDKIALGNVVFRFKVQNIKVAIKCYREETWNAYCRHLYIESGAEKGTYISGDDTLVLDGRAVYQSSYIWMYAIDGNKIRFYEYNSTDSTYTTIVGTYENDEISFVLGNSTRHFVRIKEQMTYTTKDGKYTLVCDPMQLQPESYENNKGTAKVKLNGKEVELYVNGYNTKVVYKFEDSDGKLYDIYITFSGETMEVAKKLSPIRYELTAADGSKITILFQNGLIYIEKAEFVKIEVDEGRTLYWTEASGMGVFAEQKGNTYTFSFRFRSDTYKFTVTVSEDNKTFTYTHTKA